MHGDEPGTDLDTVNGEPVRQQGQQGFGDQEQCRLRGIWFPLYEHPCSFSHQAPPSLRKGPKSQQMRWSRRGADLLLQVRCAGFNGKLGSSFGQLFQAVDPASELTMAA